MSEKRHFIAGRRIFENVVAPLGSEQVVAVDQLNEKKQIKNLGNTREKKDEDEGTMVKYIYLLSRFERRG